MSSLLEKFPGLTYADISAVPYEARFTSAPAGSINSGKITWNLISSFAHNALQGSFYFIDSISFNCGIDKAIFLNALDGDYNNGFINIDIFKTLENIPANETPITFANYRDDVPYNMSYRSNRNEKQAINFRANGQLNQTAEIVNYLSDQGKNTIDLYVSTVIYQISNSDWVAKYFEQGGKHFGR